MRRRVKAAIALVALSLLLALPASAAGQSPYPPGPIAPWDGSNPFDCELQDVGLGIDFPDPGADPFCVKFDKTRQNITELGIVDFLLNEPARVAAAVPKCFYYQRDHWTASIVQGQGPEIWNWVGSYFFDRARGVGGVNLEDFRVLGQPATLSAYVDLPPQLAPYFDQGGGGAMAVGDIPVDPLCFPRVDTPGEAAAVYSGLGPPQTPSGAAAAVPPATIPIEDAAASRKRGRRCAKRRRAGGVKAESAERKVRGKRRCGRRKPR